MYLLWFNALRVLHRTWTGPWRRRVGRDPSSRHGRAVPQAASSGTGVQSVARHLEVRKMGSVGPLISDGVRRRVGLVIAPTERMHTVCGACCSLKNATLTR